MLKFESHRHLVVHRVIDQLGPEQIEVQDGNLVWNSQAGMFVRGRKHRVIPGLGENLGQGVPVKCARIGEALTAVAYNPHPESL